MGYLDSKRGLASLALLLGMPALFFYGLLGGARYIDLNPSGFLEIIFLLVVLLGVKDLKVSRDGLCVTLACFLYLLTTFVLSQIRGVGVLDYMMAYKCFYYMALLGLINGKALASASDVIFIYRVAVLSFLARYLVEKFLYGNARPILLVENNFELIFLLFLFYAKFLVAGRVGILDFFLIISVFGLSGSRSGVVALAFCLAFCVDWKKLSLSGLAFIFGLFLSAFFIYFIFKQRLDGGDVEAIDRYRFFMEFLYSTDGWGWRYLFGAPALTPLDPQSCSSLSFYYRLFSFYDDGVCYSVILHSFIMRAVFDHGVIGLVALIFMVWVVLGNMSRSGRLCVVGILLLTGLSVSSLNNIYVALGLIFLMSVRRDAIGVKK